jgi:hypothetical protein
MQTTIKQADSEPTIKSAAEQEAEAARLVQQGRMEELWNTDIATMRQELDEAKSELDREMQVRERLFPIWIKDGKISRIDATDRFKRMQKAQHMVSYMLDICGAPVRMTTDGVPF